VAEKDAAAKCNGCGQTWSVREIGKGCPECRPRGVGKKEKGKRLKGMKTDAQGAGTAGVPEPVISSQQDEPLESLTTDPPQSESEVLPYSLHKSMRDREASQRHNAELKLSCRRIGQQR